MRNDGSDSVRKSKKIKPHTLFELTVLCALSRDRVRTVSCVRTIIENEIDAALTDSSVGKVLFNLGKLKYVEKDIQHMDGLRRTVFSLTGPGTLLRNSVIESLAAILVASDSQGKS